MLWKWDEVWYVVFWLQKSVQEIKFPLNPSEQLLGSLGAKEIKIPFPEICVYLWFVLVNGQALLDIMLLGVGASVCAVTFNPINKTASLLMLPYIAWLGLATSINYYIFQNNSKKDWTGQRRKKNAQIQTSEMLLTSFRFLGITIVCS